MILPSRALALARTLLGLLAWPLSGEVRHARPSPDEAEQRARKMTLANRDQSR